MAPQDREIRLELASGAHAEVIAGLHAACFDEAWDSQSMAGMLSMPGCIALIAQTDSGPAGCIVCRVAADEAEVLTVAVLPEQRRDGIGAALLAAAERNAVQIGAATMFLEAAEDNAAALTLYASQGYAGFGRRQGYYRRGAGKAVDAVLMNKKLEV